MKFNFRAQRVTKVLQVTLIGSWLLVVVWVYFKQEGWGLKLNTLKMCNMFCIAGRKVFIRRFSFWQKNFSRVHCGVFWSFVRLYIRGRPLMNWGRRKSRKKNCEALFQEKKFGRYSPGKKVWDYWTSHLILINPFRPPPPIKRCPILPYSIVQWDLKSSSPLA